MARGACVRRKRVVLPHLDEVELVERMAAEARTMADAYLEVFVREYVSRNRLVLVRA